MTREWMIRGLQEGYNFSGQERYDIAAQLQADGETIARLDADIARLTEACDGYKEQVQRLTDIVARRWEDNLFLSAGPGRKGGFEILIQSEFGMILAEFLAKGLRDQGAENYIELGATHPELGDLTFHVQRVSGKTPARKTHEAEAARDAAISIIADMLRLDHDGSEEEWRAICARARAVLHPADGDAT